MERNRGVALILALLVLSFLTVLGSALLTTSTIDIWISDNYKNATESLYLAEAGIDDARELLRTSGYTLSELLSMYAAQPLISSRPLGAGRYEVWLKNDNADRMTSVVDTNEIVTLVSTSQIGTTRKTIEATIQKGKFPETASDPRLQTIAGVQRLEASITVNATQGVTVVSGNAQLSDQIGYGVLLVHGDLQIVGNSTWNGLIVVMGEGGVQTNSGAALTVNGGLFIARTLSYSITDVGQIKAANRVFPYDVIALKER